MELLILISGIYALYLVINAVKVNLDYSRVSNKRRYKK
tara:strand:- start:272 stop:385 length:114 start_codon:yes stop_codon:yes gene_type:complete